MGLLAAVLALSHLATSSLAAAVLASPMVVILKDGSRYTVSKPYEIRGSQARLHLANGTLVAVRASEIDVEATKLASASPAPRPLSPTPAAQPPAAVGVASPSAAPTASVGTRVKLDKKKAETIFRQDVVPTPAPSPTATGTPGAGDSATPKDAADEMIKADLEAERHWREREANRLARLETALESQREICARYTAALSSAGVQDGQISDAAGAILGALKADCDTASRKVDGVRAERAQLEEECRKAPGCKPGWLR